MHAYKLSAFQIPVVWWEGEPKQHVAHFIETRNNTGTEKDLLVFLSSSSSTHSKEMFSSLKYWQLWKFLNHSSNTQWIVSMMELTNLSNVTYSNGNNDFKKKMK